MILGWLFAKPLKTIMNHVQFKEKKMKGRADNDEIFELLLTTLKETRTGFIANFFSGFALLLSAFGILFNYEKVKPILQIDSIYYFSLAALFIFSITYSNYLYSIKRKSEEILKQLNELNYMETKYYEHNRIKKSLFLPMLASSITMFVVMILVISWIKFFS